MGEGKEEEEEEEEEEFFFQDGIRTRWTLSRTVHGFLMLGNVKSFRVEVMR